MPQNALDALVKGEHVPDKKEQKDKKAFGSNKAKKVATVACFVSGTC